MNKQYEFWFEKFTNFPNGTEINQEINQVDDNGDIITPKIVSLYGYGRQQLWLSPGLYRVTNYVIGTEHKHSYEFTISEDGKYISND